jgi:hypothetical protein
MTKEIPLTQGKVAIVDDCDFEWLNQWKWLAHNNHNLNWYAKRTDYHGGLRKEVIIMHRLIIGAEKGQYVDHKDRDGLNNQRGNLRFCTKAQNAQNMELGSRNTSGFKGVSRDHGKQWRATIRENNRQYRIGHFPTALEAALAYDVAAKRLHGEFARLNFPEKAFASSFL